MLDGDVSETGVAIARSEETGYYYAVQMFGRPKSAAIEFSLNNKTKTAIDYQIGEEKFSLPAGYTRTHQRCRPELLKVQNSAAKDDSSSAIKNLNPANGDHFVITDAGDSIQIKRE